MKKIVLIVLLIFVCFTIYVNGATSDLPEVLTPDSIFVKGNNLYIIEGDLCRIYSIPQMKYLKSFCKSGEGPGEVKTMPGLSAGISETHDEKILIEGMNKILFYTVNGDFIGEKKKGGRFFRTNKAGENYVTLGMTINRKSGRSFLTLSIFSGEFKLIRELYKQEMKDNDKDIEMVIKTIRYSIWNDKIFLIDNIGDNPVIVFDSDGKELYRFKVDIKAKKVDDEFRAEELKRLKDDDFISMMIKREGGWDNFRKKMNFIFPGTLPAIQGITVAHNRVHLLTYNRKDKKERFIITDLKGNVIKKIFLPVHLKSSFLAKMLGRENKFYAFSAENYYYLSEDEETETFRIRTINLKNIGQTNFQIRNTKIINKIDKIIAY